MKTKWSKQVVSLLCIATISLQTTGCSLFTKKTVNPEEEQARFNEYVQNMFIEDVQSDSITLNYTLANPEKYGITDYEPTFGECSVEQSKKDLVETENAYSTLTDFSYDALTEDQQLLYDILDDYLKVDKSDEKFLLYGEPLGSTTGLQAQLPVLLAEYNFYDKEDIDHYLELLTCIGDYFSEVEQYEKAKSEAGLFMSDHNADNIIAQCEEFTRKPDNNYMITLFNDRIDEYEGLTEEEKEDYKKRNKDAIFNHVIPAYNHLTEFLKGLKGTGKNDGGVCHFKDGKEYYEKLAQGITGSDKTISEMKTALTRTITKSAMAMDALTMNDDSIYDAFFKMEFPMTKPKKIIDYLKDEISNDFPKLEPVDCDIKYVHESMEDYLSPAFYLTPALDNYKDNNIYINRGGNNDMSTIFTTLAHEGYPGHLYQNVYFNQQEPEPIRALLNYGGYSEGWATYCEMYSYDISGLDKNLANFAKQYNILMLCMYAEMDIGVNYDGWSLEELQDYLSDYGVTEKDAAQEVFDIVVDDPANYLQYVIGYIEFADLRSTAEAELGDDFNAKEFHTFLLDIGPASFPVIEKYMDDWMESQKS